MDVGMEYGRFGMVGLSPPMLKLYEMISKVAPANVTVLIRGDRGTGKEMVATALLSGSSRKDKPYIAVNCAAMPSEIFESELFGHEKGSFTGAYQSREGKFEYADGGTMFLDEIADMPLHLQPKLLRAIEYGTFQRVGSNETLGVDVRLMAATSRDLKTLADEGSFRYELYDRLNVVALDIPPLRERRDDIPLLVRHFLDGRQEIDDGAMECFYAYE